MIKIGIQILAYNCAESFSKLIEPWARLKEELNFVFWVGSGQFKIYKEMGCEDLNQETIKLLTTEYKDVIDFLFIPDSNNLLSDHDMRSQCLGFFEEEDVDLLWILDADEFYSEEEIRRVVEFVQHQQEYDYYRISMKSYVMDNNHWVDFIPMRIVWRKRFGGIRNYYFDNHYCYHDNSEYRSHKCCDIPKEVVFPLHYTWTQYHNTTGPKKIQDKIEYQKRYYSDGCGYYYDEEKDKVVSNVDNQEVFIVPKFNKNIILSPNCCGKTIFLQNNQLWYEGVRLFCGEFESSSRNYVNGIMMGSDSHFLQTYHDLYRSWDDIYKIGVDWYNSYRWNFASSMIYNCSNHIPHIVENYNDIHVAVVMPDYDIMKRNWELKINSNKDLNEKLSDLIRDNSPVLKAVPLIYDWNYIHEEIEMYKKMIDKYNIPVYGSFESALESILGR